LAFQFDDTFRLDDPMAQIAILGTIMTYRIFDGFDIDVGLVFAFFSIALCAILLLVIDFARNRGRHFETTKALQRLVGMMVPLGISLSLWSAAPRT